MPLIAFTFIISGLMAVSDTKMLKQLNDKKMIALYILLLCIPFVLACIIIWYPNFSLAEYLIPK